MKKFKHELMTLIGIASLFAILGPSLIIQNTPDQEIPLNVWIYLIIIFFGILSILTIVMLINKWIKYEYLTQLLKSVFLILFLKIVYDYSGISGIIEPLDGAPKAKDFSLMTQVVSALIFFITTIIIFIFFRRHSQIIELFFKVAILISFLMPIYIFLSYQYIQGNNNDQNYNFHYSKEKNIIIILADSLQGTLSGYFFKENPEIISDFNGFTIYPNGISPFPFTNYSLPAFLSGKNYAKFPENDFKNNLQYAQENSFITDAINKGYKHQIVGLKNLQFHPQQKNLYYGYPGPDLSQALVKLTVQRIFKLNLRLESKTENQQLISLKKLSLDVMNSMIEGNVIESNPIITVVHNFIPHTPIYFPNFDDKDDEKVFNSNNYYNELNFFYKALNKFFKKLEEIGIYNNSLIIVLGDHGHFINSDPSLYKYSFDKNDLQGYETGPWDRTIGMYNPLVMIKPPYSNSKPFISNSAMNIKNVRELVNKFLNENEIKLEDLKNQSDEIIVFKNPNISPYLYSHDHKILKYNGSINDLLYKYTFPLDFIKYNFGSTLTPANEVLYGQWVKEEKGSWLKGQKSRAIFKIINSPKSEDIFLNLKITPLISNSYQYQDLELMANGKDIGSFRLNRPEQELKIRIPYSIYNNNNNIFRLDFVPINPVSPKDIGLWEESGLLSIYIHSLSLSEH